MIESRIELLDTLHVFELTERSQTEVDMGKEIGREGPGS